MEGEEKERTLSYSNVVSGSPADSPAAYSSGRPPAASCGRPPGLPQTPFAGSLQRNRNTRPKARQRQGPPPSEVVAAAPPLPTTVTYRTRTYSNSNRRPPGENRDFDGSRNTLPRSARRDSRPSRGGGGGGGGGNQYSSYGTIPRSCRQSRGGSGRPQSYAGGSGGSLVRGGSRGYLPDQQRPLQNRTGPSQRIIHRSRQQQQQSRPGMEAAGRPPSQGRRTRAHSLPRHEPAAAAGSGAEAAGSYYSDLAAARSLVTIWSPDGKCPSFADILKRSSYAGSADPVDRGNSKYMAEAFFKINLICSI